MISPLNGATPTSTQNTLLNGFGEKMSNGDDRSPSPSLNAAQPSASIGSHSPVEENEVHNSTDDSSNTNNSGGMEQLLFQRLASNFAPGFPLRSTFQFNNLAPFLASLQHQQRGQRSDDSNQQNLEQQMLGALAAASSSVTLNSDYRADSVDSADGHSIEPEDLSLREKLRGDDDGNGNTASNWSFEEQFKQLYDLSDDIKRKQWLDDWFKFMQEQGKPVTRIPIMAKQVLDLYELYRLVVQHGGLVEIINKKLWREITKGLNLPSSITSAAFTLRTQYQKYLYDYECAREGLSLPQDLQSAIEGNKREGRRNPPTSNGSTPLHHHHSNGAFSYPLVPSSAAAAMSSLFARHMNPFAAMHSEDPLSSLAGGRPSIPNTNFGDPLGVDMQQRQMEMIQRVADVLTQQNQQSNSGRASASSVDSASSPKRPRHSSPVPNDRNVEKRNADSPSQQRNAMNGLDQLLKSSASTHLKLTSNGNKSMVVSMEVNGTMFQGVLFAVNSINNDLMMNGDAMSDLFGANET